MTLAQLNSNANICNNTSTNFNVVLTGGTSPFTINYSRNGVAQTAISGYISGTNISTGSLSTGTYNYVLTSVTDANGCLAQNLGTGITIISGSNPSNATFTSSGDACYNTASSLSSVITGGAPPYILTIAGFAGSPVSNFYSGDNINLGVLSPGTHTYTLTSVVDNCGNPLLSGLPKTVTITVFDQLSGGTIAAGQVICYNSLPAAFTNSLSPSGGTALAYQWQRSPAGAGSWSNISGATGLSYTETTNLTANTDYRRVTTSGNGCGTVYSNVITVTVYSNLTPGSIGTSQSICFNTTPSGLTQASAPAGGTGTYTFQWQSSPDNLAWSDISGANSSAYSPGALTASVYYRRNVTSGSCGTVSSNAIQITVYGNLTPGSIDADQTICFNTTPSGLTQATAPTGGTGTYSYQWQSSPNNSAWSNISGATSATYLPGALTTSIYYRRNVTSGTCGTVSSNSIHIIVYANLTAGAIGTDQNICYNTSPSGLTEVTAPGGGTGTYTYQWQRSPNNSTWTDISGANSSTYSPGVLTASIYYRRNVTSGTCGTVSSASVHIVVYTDLTAGSIGTDQTICYNTIPTGLTQVSAPSGGTGTYTYQWQSSPNNSSWANISGANSSTYSPGALTLTTYFRRNVTSGTCGTLSSNSILITVYGNLTPGTIEANQTICYNSTPSGLVEATAPTGGTGSYTYQWQISSNNSTFVDIPTATSVNYSPGSLSATRYYRRNVTSGSCGTVSSVSVEITVYPILSAGTIGTDQSICYNAAPAGLTELTAPAGGTGTYTYQWQSSPNNIAWSNVSGANTATYSPGALTSSIYFRRNVTSGTCGTASSPSVHIIVYADLTPGSIGAPQTICENATPAGLNTGNCTFGWNRNLCISMAEFS